MQEWDYVFFLCNILTGDITQVMQSSLDASSFNPDSDGTEFFKRLTHPPDSLRFKQQRANVSQLFYNLLERDRELSDELNEKNKADLERVVSHFHLISTLGTRGWEYVEFHKVGAKHRLYTFKKDRTSRENIYPAGGQYIKIREFLIFHRHKANWEFHGLVIMPAKTNSFVDYKEYGENIFSEMERKVEDYREHLSQRLSKQEFRNIKEQLSHMFLVAILGGDGWEFVQHLKVGPNTRFHMFRREIIQVHQP